MSASTTPASHAPSLFLASCSAASTPSILLLRSLFHQRQSLILQKEMTASGKNGRRCNHELFTYTSLIYGLCEVLNLEEPLFYLDELLKERLSPTVATWNVLASSVFCALGFSGLIHLVENILGEA